MGADILALHTRQTALKGGSTHVASAWKVYNELAVSNPRVLETLADASWPIQMYVGLARDKAGEEANES